MSRSSLTLALLLLVAGPVAAQSDDDNETLDALVWMSGCWSAGEGAGSADECWLDRRGNTMMGFHVDVLANGNVFFENLRIVADGERVTYYASPMGSDATAFELVALDGQRVVFENREHDWPQRLTYWRTSDELHALAEGIDPASRKAEWVWALSPVPNR